MKSLGVYIHIPFCVQKCVYCDFLSSPATKDRQKEYMTALKREIETEAQKYKEFQVNTIFFGGGTPSILAAGDIKECMDILKSNYNISQNAEITMEMNPGTATNDKFIELKNAGINRLSIGLQSANNDELKLLGRIHTYEEFLQTYTNARNAGFENINIDLMSALPGQSCEDWIDNVQKVLALKPEHISAYSLIVEEGTPLYDNLDSYPQLPSEEEDREMYQETKKILALNGYERYEVSNYAKKGFECKHNIVYWQRDNYVGFGLGAASMVENMRWSNTSDMKKYLEYNNDNGDSSIKEDVHKLSKEECMEEFMFLGLRMTKGVRKKAFFELFGNTIEEIYGNVINKWEMQEMLVQNKEYVFFTDKGIDVSNVILADFLF